MGTELIISQYCTTTINVPGSCTPRPSSCLTVLEVLVLLCVHAVSGRRMHTLPLHPSTSQTEQIWTLCDSWMGDNVVFFCNYCFSEACSVKLCLTGIFFPIERCAEACFVHLDADFTEASYVFVISGRFLQMITNLLCSTTLKLQWFHMSRLLKYQKRGLETTTYALYVKLGFLLTVVLCSCLEMKVVFSF